MTTRAAVLSFVRRTIRRPRWLLLPLAGIALVLSGCIYLRLLELKQQLAQFERYFETDTSSGLKLTCKQPVLLDEDMAFFQLAPESRQSIGVAERWHFRWVKAYPVAAEDPRDFEVTSDFIFVGHKLNRVILPERFFVFFPKKLFLSLLRSLGHAEIDRAKRTAHAQMDAKSDGAVSVPQLIESDLRRMLGAPMEIQQTETERRLHYRYKAASTDQHSGRIDLVFTLNPATQQVRRIKGQVFDAALDVGWSDNPTSGSTTAVAK